MSLHITTFEGASALSDFRIAQLLPRLAAISPQIQGISARFVHLVATQEALADAQKQTLAALLTYGEPPVDPSNAAAHGPVIVVCPRLGTVSPWASKATDIAHNCGFAVRRVERLTEYRLAMKSGLLGTAKLSAEQLAQVAAVLHDRMTESAMTHRDEAAALFTALEPAPMAHVDVLSSLSRKQKGKFFRLFFQVPVESASLQQCQGLVMAAGYKRNSVWKMGSAIEGCVCCIGK